MADGLMSLGMLHSDQGDPDRAREALQRVVDLHELWQSLEPSTARQALATQWAVTLAEHDRARAAGR